MKSFLSFFLILSLSFEVFGQSWMQSIGDTLNFYEIQEQVEQYWKGKTPAKGSGWKQYKRWEYMMKPRVYPTGNPIDPTILWTEWQKARKNLPQHSAYAKGGGQDEELGTSGNWTEIGPDVVPGNGGGLGRINCLEFDPVDPSILWAGTPDGGLWKSTNAGVGWTSNTDLLPNLGVSDIAINPENTDIMYIATGDGFGIDYGNGSMWGGTYSMGVLKSIDGGTTWNTTGLNWTITQTRLVHRLLIHPDNPDTVFAGTSNGIYRTTNGGSTWTQLQTGQFFDLEFKPGSPSTIYASGSDVYKSTNNGNTWTQMSFWFQGAISLAVTPANSNVVYAFCEDMSSFYKSSNSASTWTATTYPGIGYVQGWYMLALAVSPSDENTVYAGGMDLAKSTNGGASWTTVTDWSGWPSSDYSHADHRAIEFYPGSSSIIYDGNDGGVFKSTDAGATWTDLSAGLAITQFYKMGASQSDAGIIYGGAQDNGVDRLTGGTWTDVGWSDGMECIVDHSNNNIVYFSIQYGNLSKSTDGGQSFTSIHSNSGDWVVPFIMNPSDPLVLYVGEYGGIYKTTDGGSSWNFLSSGLSSFGYISTMEIARSNTSTLYCSAGSKFFGGTIEFLKSTNAGSSWTTASSGLPISTNYITGIAIDEANSSLVWVTVSGLDAGVKVFRTTNGGASWSNISGSLPNVSVNCITHARDSLNGLYVGNDFGVYYMNDTTSGWAPYMNGLPNVMVSELEIQFAAEKIRAATYGRGFWESDLYSTNGPPTAAFTVSTTQICAGESLVFTDQSLNNATSWSWTFQGGTPVTSTQQNNTVIYNSAGTFDVVLVVSNSNGSDTITSSNYITVLTLPAAPTILQSGDTLNSSVTAANYQWYLDGNLISGATAQFYVPTQGGSYTLTITDANGCSATSSPVTTQTPTAQAFAAVTGICVGESISFTDQSTGNPDSLSWVFSGGDPATSTSPDNTVIYNDTGIFDVLLVASNTFGSDSLLLADYITVYPLPPVSPMFQDNDSLYTTASPGSYQWFFNSSILIGATNQYYIASQTGGYTVLYTDSNGCSSTSLPFLFVVDGLDENNRGIRLVLFPNPNTGLLTLDARFYEDAELTLKIKNTIGQLVYLSKEQVKSGPYKKQLDVSDIPAGVYFLQFTAGEWSTIKRFVVE